MASLTGAEYESQVPLDLRVRRDRPENDLFSSKGASVRSYPSGGSIVQETGKLIKMHDSILKIVKQEKGRDFEYDESIQYHYTARDELYPPPERLLMQTNRMHDTFFNFIKQENGRFDYPNKAVYLPYPPEREFYPNKAGTLNVTVKQESETDESYCQASEKKLCEKKFCLADDILTRADEHSSDDDNLIIDLNFEESSPGKKRLDRSNSNCSSNSSSSCNSEITDDVRAFLRTYSSPIKGHECSKCKLRFGDLYSLFIHLDVHVSQNPGERYMKCPLCMRKFQKMYGIAAHIRKMHLGPMDHVCRFCRTPFKFNLHLQKHEATCKKKKRKDSIDDNCANFAN